MTIEKNVVKALARADSNAFEMENVTSAIERSQAQPGLLTAILGGVTNDIYLDTNTVKYDDIEETLQLPNSKRFDQFGNRIKKDRPRELIYSVGSFGITDNVAPGDVVNRRKPGTSELLTEDELVARQLRKMDKSWAAFTELGFAQLLTLDTNITDVGSQTDSPHTEYNFYTDVMGGARPAAASMNLAGSVDHWQLFSEQVDLLETDVQKTGNSMTMAVVLCGKTFFNSRLEIEKQEGLGRDVRGRVDLATMGVPESTFGSGIFSYQNFLSPIDGILYVKYSANILGSKMIADGSAYMIPMGVENLFKRAFAPAQTREYVNTAALPMYAWTETHDRRGTTTIQESNVLFMSVCPQLVRRLSAS